MNTKPSPSYVAITKHRHKYAELRCLNCGAKYNHRFSNTDVLDMIKLNQFFLLHFTFGEKKCDDIDAKVKAFKTHTTDQELIGLYKVLYKKQMKYNVEKQLYKKI